MFYKAQYIPTISQPYGIINAMKKSNIITLNPAHFPFAVYHQPIHQLRLMPRAVLIHRDTAYPSDVEYARQAFGHAHYYRMEILVVETWYAAKGK